MLIDQTDEEFKKMPKGEWPSPEEEEFQMLERQLSGWRKRQIALDQKAENAKADAIQRG